MPVNTIFIIDDDEDDVEITTDAIIGINPQTCIRPFKDGSAMLLFLQNCTDSELPSLFIIDYQMPLMTGPQLLEQLNKLRYLSIPKFVLSTSPTIQNKASCIQAGAWGYFIKPSTFAELKAIIAQMLDECNRSNTVI